MKIKVAEATNLQLNWLVATIEGMAPEQWAWYVEYNAHRIDVQKSRRYDYTTYWGVGGPIIEREKIELKQGNPLYFPKGNEVGDHYESLWIAGKTHGPTPLIAAMRCYVASKLGNEVTIPKELV